MERLKEVRLNETIFSRAEQSRAEQSRAERNNYIDFLRGIASIGIIAIHTAFWAGQSYTPEWFWNLTLLLDVPFFFYLSGWVSSYKKSDIKKTCKSILDIWCKWIFFVSVVSVFCFFSHFFPFSFEGVSDIKDLFQNYMFNVSIPGFCVVAGSIWFLPCYFVLIFVNAIIMTILEGFAGTTENKKTYMWILIGVFIWISYGQYFFGLDVQYFLFYSFFWMLGMNKMGKAKNLRQLLMLLSLLALGTMFSSYLQGLPLYDLQSAKFPPSIKYGFASLITIVLAKYFEGRYSVKKNFIEHIGKNAIYYYFAQGIGSSINYYVVGMVNLNNWLFKWILAYGVNFLVTILIAEALSFMYSKLIIKRIYSGLFVNN